MAKKALCLSGGASRGSFQMGAIKCLYEAYGFRPDVIAGTSVGAINGIKLACAPPPAINDSQGILYAVSRGIIDHQLTHMRELEQFWFAFQARSHFFTIKPAFIGTKIEEFLKEKTETDVMETPIGTDIDRISVLINMPLVHFVAAPIAVDELQKIKYLIETIDVENAIATLEPVEIKVRAPRNINIGSAIDKPPYQNNLFNGTPLYMAMVALETGNLRYATNKGEFYERDGVSPVVTALADSDIDLALDENLQPLSTVRKNHLKFVVAKYKAAVAQMAAYRIEFKNSNTPNLRKRVLLAAYERERERGNHYTRAAKQQIQGMKITVKIDPRLAAVGSSSLPALLESQVVGVERYIDGGLREIIPVEILLDHDVTQIVGILCSTIELPETDSIERVGLAAVGARAMQIALNEVTRGDLATAESKGIDTRFIIPAIDIHDGLDVKSSLIEISMHYGWLRTADEMQPVTDLVERKLFRQSSELLARLRLKCFELEGHVPSMAVYDILPQKWGYFELRVNRWAIMHLAAHRTALGLPAHPTQATWSTEWEHAFRGGTSVWSALKSSNGQHDLWPSSSASEFNPDIGSIEDAGSDRIYWMVRGAIFEDKSGSALATPLANVVVPSGLHQFLPKVPIGTHLMAETQDQTTLWLVAGGKKYSSLTPQLIEAAGLTGEPVAIVPQGGLAQLPDGGIPYFLGNLCVVDAHNVALFELTIERIQQSMTVVDISIHNRSATNTLTDISVQAVFDQAQNISMENVPNSIPPNTIDSFTLRLHPTEDEQFREFNGSLLINSSDTILPTIKVGLKLRVLPLGDMAKLDFTPKLLEIHARVNDTSSRSILTITNTGVITPDSISASIEPTEVQSLFNVGQYLHAIDFTPGKTIQVPIFFYPTTAGRFNGELVLTVGGNTSNNHPYMQTLRIPLIGNAGVSMIRLLGRTPEPSDFLRFDLAQTSLRINIGTIQPPVHRTATFFILNLGALSLEITTILGYYASVTTSQQFPITIAAGTWVEVPLDFGLYKLPGIGAFTETIRIFSDDPLTQEAQVVLEGIVGGAKATIVPEFIDFSMVAVKTPSRGMTTFRNEGTVDLLVSETTWQFSNGFSLVQFPALPFPVPAGGSLALEIEFGPVAVPGFYNDVLTLVTSEKIVATLGVQATVYVIEGGRRTAV